ncbi:MAG: hypothetical protein HYW34_00590 [Candidatus Brennerbacteria bacterium]|nr:hypothetical protein [Candidatus Brennerbacteria bacterium]
MGEETINLKTEAVEWDAPEFFHRPKTVSWYWLSVIAAIIILVFAWWQKNIFFGFFIIIAEVMLIYFAGQEPRVLKFSINERGVAIDNYKEYSYDALEDFSIRRKNEEFSELIIKTKSHLNRHLKILIQEKSAGAAKEILSKHLPEVEHEDSLLDALHELSGF